MKIRDILHETYSALFTNKVRTGLTMLGIIIGIASVIAMTAIGQGAQNSVSSQIESIGANLVMITPGAQKSFGGPSGARGGAQSLTLEDADAIENQISNVDDLVREVSTRQQVVATGTNTNTSIMGTESSYQTVRNVSIAEGNFISEQNVSSGSKVAVLGPTTRDDLFGEDATDVIGQKIRISGSEYTIIGITESKGGSGFSNSDDIVYIPYTTAQRYLSGNKYLSEIDVSATSSEVSSQVQEDITTLLLELHDIENSEDADFSTMNQSDIIETASSVTSTFTTLLAAVAGISLLVGGIGIMNMMLTTVTERTREIGLRKAIGAKKRDINNQFLFEATMLTFIGGIAGVILGWLISIGIGYFSSIEASVSLSSVLLAFGVSAVIGILFGYYPAHRAANLNPIDALRYE
ncbi:MAG TPA: ABC transporter permease [Candidatus Paceibacterota bacterium]|nr:ABC transporter permease [Candidatus Paceibacterota bacterium]HPT17977.1 ABC transporter permease [Candidatus Paceibacterota bacterium]